MSSVSKVAVGASQPVGFFDHYLQSLNTNPILTKAATSGTLYSLQELVAAAITRSPVDSKKALKMSLYGFFVSGPLGHFLYASMEKIFAAPLPSSSSAVTAAAGPRIAILKLLYSNLIITPISNASYLFALALFAGASPAKALKIVRARLLGLMKISWIISPLAQTFAFRNLDPNLYVPFFNLVAFFFGTLVNVQGKLEAKKNSGKDKDGKEIKKTSK